MSTVLIIEEREAVRTALEILLSLNGHRVIAASGPEQGLRSVAAEQVDLVILQAEPADDDIPGETSIALMRAIRTSRPSVPFVVLTAPDKRAVAELLSAEGIEHITLPWNNEHLLRTIRFLLDQPRSAAHGGAEPSESDIQQALLRTRGALSRAARQLGMSKDALAQRLRKLRLMS